MNNQQADMRQHEQEMREAFEKWCNDNCLFDTANFIKDEEEREKAKSKNLVWRSWQAATLAAEARIRELEADANRYRWLRDKSEYGDDFYLSVPFESPKDTFKPHEVDEAIDSAITEHKENQG